MTLKFQSAPLQISRQIRNLLQEEQSKNLEILNYGNRTDPILSNMPHLLDQDLEYHLIEDFKVENMELMMEIFQKLLILESEDPVGAWDKACNNSNRQKKIPMKEQILQKKKMNVSRHQKDRNQNKKLRNLKNLLYLLWKDQKRDSFNFNLISEKILNVSSQTWVNNAQQDNSLNNNQLILQKRHSVNLESILIKRDQQH